jgi:hypothetical protein
VAEATLHPHVREGDADDSLSFRLLLSVPCAAWRHAPPPSTPPVLACLTSPSLSIHLLEFAVNVAIIFMETQEGPYHFSLPPPPTCRIRMRAGLTALALVPLIAAAVAVPLYGAKPLSISSLPLAQLALHVSNIPARLTYVRRA